MLPEIRNPIVRALIPAVLLLGWDCPANSDLPLVSPQAIHIDSDWQMASENGRGSSLVEVARAEPWLR
jgi:hypothetical protein